MAAVRLTKPVLKDDWQIHFSIHSAGSVAATKRTFLDVYEGIVEIEYYLRKQEVDAQGEILAFSHE